MKAKGQVGGATLTVKQHVPAGKWALLPNPGEHGAGLAAHAAAYAAA